MHLVLEHIALKCAVFVNIVYKTIEIKISDVKPE